MKRLLPFLILCSCSTTQLQQTRTVADPLVAGAVRGYAASHGVPPALTDALVTPLQNEFWSYLYQANHLQPISQGATNPTIASAVVKANGGAEPSTAQLQAALSALGAKP